MAINVNYYDEVIYITSPTTNVTIQELLNALRLAEDTPEGLAFGGLIKTVTDGFVDAEGAADVGGGYLNPITMTLDDSWYIEFWDGVNLGTVAGGNVAGGKDGRPIRCEVGSADTALALGAERGIQVASVEMSQSNIDDIADGVWEADPADFINADNMGGAMLRNLLMSQENHFMDQTVYQTYDGIKQLTSARIRLYSNAGSVGTDSDVVATYLVTSTWTTDEMDDIKIVKQ